MPLGAPFDLDLDNFIEGMLFILLTRFCSFDFWRFGGWGGGCVACRVKPWQFIGRNCGGDGCGDDCGDGCGDRFGDCRTSLGLTFPLLGILFTCFARLERGRSSLGSMLSVDELCGVSRRIEIELPRMFARLCILFIRRAQVELLRPSLLPTFSLDEFWGLSSAALAAPRIFDSGACLVRRLTSLGFTTTSSELLAGVFVGVSAQLVAELFAELLAVLLLAELSAALLAELPA